MSSVEHDEEVRPAQSKVEISRNSKGDDQWRVVVREGTTEAEMDVIREIAVRQHQLLERDLSGPPL